MSVNPPVPQPATGKKVAIMQPTFLPWTGYMALMDHVDEFVFLDHVQFDKRSWQQRNRIRTANGPQWLTVPVISRGKSDQAIRDVLINRDTPDFPRKMIGAIEHSYSKAAFYKDYAEDVFSILSRDLSHLLDLNIALIGFFKEQLEIDTPVSFSSRMDVGGRKAALLADICRECGADIYISPPGSKDYLDAADEFEAADIPVRYFVYEHPVWPQVHGDFEPYMSVLDLLMNCGPDAGRIMREGIRCP